MYDNKAEWIEVTIPEVYINYVTSENVQQIKYLGVILRCYTHQYI